MSEEKTVPAMSDAELERMLAQVGAASVQVPEGFRCGYVAVIGRPNVGKSTLINHLIGEKVSITSKKPQTTRDRVLGVVTEPDAQIVFMDTPGFQTKVGNQLIRRMNRTVRSTLGEVDAIVFVIESLGWKPADLSPQASAQGCVERHPRHQQDGPQQVEGLAPSAHGRLDGEVPVCGHRARVR